MLTNFTTLPLNTYNSTALVVLDNSVLDVTDYLTSATNLVMVAKNTYSRSFAVDRMFLPLDLTILLFSNMGRDITKEFYSDIAEPQLYKECLNELFFRGVVDANSDEGCARVNVALWITLGCFLLYFLLKMNLANLSRWKFMQKFLYKSVPDDKPIPTFSRAASSTNLRLTQPHVLFFIPCFSESSHLIRQTFDSLARANFPDNKKLLFFVCDGVAKNKVDTKETYICVLEALGYSSSNEPELCSYISLGQGSRRVNYAKVFAGFYESGSNRVPFLMVVKVGAPVEWLSTTRIAGNRGKRDSLVMVLGFLERCMNLALNRITPLEFELFNQCYNLLGIDPRDIKYMLMTDADTRVHDDVVIKLVSRMESDPKVSAISGHIRPANPEENILTMLQIFPLYMTFYSGLAYEACLGRVTTLNGGFVMFRVWSKVEKNMLDDEWLRDGIEMVPVVETPSKERHLKKWPKVSDEIIVPDEDHDSGYLPSLNTSKGVVLNLEADNSSSDDNSKSTHFNTNTTTIASASKTHHRRRRRPLQKQKSSNTKSALDPLNLAANPNIQLCCAHPTVLRNFAAMRPDTMHMENVLLLGEEQSFSLILLRSLPNYHLAFEPEAIGYITIPTNFFALQALCVRNIRATFHIQLEFMFTARHFGITYWIVSLTKLLDIIFTMPLTVYLYTVFIRYFMYNYLVFGVIAIAFTLLLCMYIVFFLLRLQFRFIIWLLLYCLFSVPFFNVYCQLLAVWCSDFAYRWCDAYPIKTGSYHSRLHGAVMDERADESTIDDKEVEETEEAAAEKTVVRMRLGDFEMIEAEKTAKREKEQAEILDAKFSDFNGYINTAAVNINGHMKKPSWSSNRSSITVPPSAQLKDKGKTHSRYASEDDAHFLLSPNNRSPTRPASASSSHSPHNPFLSVADDPFEDMYINYQNHRPDRTPPLSTKGGHHRKSSSSRLSNFGRRSFIHTRHEKTSSVGSDNPIIQHYRSLSGASSSYPLSVALPSPIKTPQEEEPHSINDNDSIVSLNPSIISSVFSLEAENVEERNHLDYNPHRIIIGAPPITDQGYLNDVSEGRNAPIHSRLTSNQK